MTSSSEVEVTRISKYGIWLKDKEHFLSFENFPWFEDASVSTIHNFELLNERHLYWLDLDVDLAVDSIDNPCQFPLVARPDNDLDETGEQ
jgi:hypothetical protein